MLAQKNLELTVDGKLKEILAKRGYDPVYGARPLKRLITEIIMNPLANKLLEGQYKPGDTVQLSANSQGEVVFSKK